MLLDNIQNNIDHDVEFLFERPVGWSSACLDSTIDYYLSCNNQEIYLEESLDIEQYKS